LGKIADWEEPLRETIRVLKIDGRLIVTVHHPIDYAIIEQDGQRLLGFDNHNEIGDYLVRHEFANTANSITLRSSK